MLGEPFTNASPKMPKSLKGPNFFFQVPARPPFVGNDRRGLHRLTPLTIAGCGAKPHRFKGLRTKIPHMVLNRDQKLFPKCL